MNWKINLSPFRSTAIIVTMFFGLLGCEDPKSMEPMEFTQCFVPLDNPSKLARHETFYRDQKRGCFGQRWRMPRAYFARSLISYHPVAESFKLRVHIADQSPAVFLPKEKQIPVDIEVTIDPIFSGNFETHLNNFRRINLGPGKGIKSLRLFHNMSVYDIDPKIWDGTKRQDKEVILVPSDGTKFFVTCWGPYDRRIEAFSAKTTCRVSNIIDNRIWLRYYIPIADMPKVRSTNDGMLKLIRNFMQDN
jgi:hypothetical protein